MSVTKKEAIDLMTSRGYELVASFESGGETTGVALIKRLNDELTIHAKVSLKDASVVLEFLELKYFCKIAAQGIALTHPDFEKYEQIIMAYAAKCLEIDVFQVLALLPLKRESLAQKPATESPKKDLAIRKREFWDQIVSIGKKRDYPKAGCKAFYEYWIQKNNGGTKMQFEITKVKKGVFDVGGRLATWMKNDKEWASSKKNFVEKKAEAQDDQIRNIKQINKNDLF